MAKKAQKVVLGDIQNIKTPYKKTVPECEGCKSLVVEMNALKESVDKMKKDIKSTISDQNISVMSILAQQKVTLEKLVRQDNVLTSVRQFFPLKSTDELTEMESKIFPENAHLFITTMRALLNHSVKKHLNYILATDIIMTYNVEGTHGKKGLMQFEKFYSALLESISSISSSEEPHKQLREAMQLHKKREFQKRCADKCGPSTSKGIDNN